MSSLRSLFPLLALVLAGLPASALATPLTAARAKEAAGNVVSAARRATAIGPFLGGNAIALDDGHFDGALTFGLGFRFFKNPALDVSAIKEKALAIAKKRAQDRAKQMLARGERPTAVDVQRLTEQIAGEVFDDVLRGLKARPPTLQEPAFVLSLEGGPLFDADAWQARVGLGLGVWKLSVGPSFALQLGGGTAVLLGPEVGLHLLPGSGPRSPEVQLFGRWDFSLRKRDTFADAATIGVRLLLDLI